MHSVARKGVVKLEVKVLGRPDSRARPP